MAQNLAPLPQPGFSVHPGYMATQPHTFVSRDNYGGETWSGKHSFTISYASPTGESMAPFVNITGKKKELAFQDTHGRTVMYISKRHHAWGWKPTTYHGFSGDGRELWVLTLKQMLGSGTSYQLAFTQNHGTNVMIQNHVAGAAKGVLINGVPGATMSQHKAFTKFHRLDIINVAPGMDILLALAVNWIRVDKQNQDAAAIAGVAG